MMKKIERIKHHSMVLDNHWYFLLFFGALFTSYTLQVLLVNLHVDAPFWKHLSVIFFQSLLETFFLCALSKALKSFKKIHTVFVIFTFFILIAHLVDLPLERFMGLSTWSVLEKFSHESLENIFELLVASNIPVTVWFIGIAMGITCVFIGLILYQFLDRYSQVKPWEIAFKKAGILFVIAPAFFMILSMQTTEHMHTYYSLSKGVMPWKVDFKEHRTHFIGAPLGALREQPVRQVFQSEAKPDIFLFVVESLRRDVLKEGVAPNLCQFQKDFFSFNQAYSSGNATQLSWYSLFFSEPSIFWEGSDKNAQGSPNLKHLKEMGYAIHVLSASRLNYYNMDKILFGSSYECIDSLQLFRDSEAMPVYEADKKMMQTLNAQVHAGNKGGRFFIVFLDSTHFGYSLPDDMELPFQPYPEKINYLSALYSKKTLQGIKNRYKNAVYGIDLLMGGFFESLKTSASWDDSIILFTADHAEEFYERGHLFHASHLSYEQTHIPLLCKFGKQEKNVSILENRLCSHEDIFPTLFDCLGGISSLEGLSCYSLLDARRIRPCVLCSRFNFNLPPAQFSLHDGRYKIVLERDQHTKLSENLSYTLHSVSDSKDNPLPIQDNEAVKKSLYKAYQKLCNN